MAGFSFTVTTVCKILLGHCNTSHVKAVVIINGIAWPRIQTLQK